MDGTKDNNAQATYFHTLRTTQSNCSVPSKEHSCQSDRTCRRYQRLVSKLWLFPCGFDLHSCWLEQLRSDLLDLFQESCMRDPMHECITWPKGVFEEISFKACTRASQLGLSIVAKILKDEHDNIGTVCLNCDTHASPRAQQHLTGCLLWTERR
jgi:hypothetical protein